MISQSQRLSHRTGSCGAQSGWKRKHGDHENTNLVLLWPSQEQFAENESEHETAPDTQFKHVAGQQMAALLDKLPKEQTEILLLAYVEGKSHREIAEQLGIPIGTTKSRVRLAFQRLRKLMENTP